MTADWQLPVGVSRAVWDYAHDESIAANYDATLAETPLLRADLAFVQRHISEPCDVVDLGCGTGRVTIPLATAGHRVVGVDLSQPMLQVARNKANGNLVHWMCGNIADLASVRSGVFDAGLCLFSTLGMVAGSHPRRQTICEAHRLLRPGGVFILHVHHVGRLLSTHSLRLGWMRDQVKRLLRRSGSGDFPMPSADGLPGWTMHLFTRREIVVLLQNAGFTDIDVVAINTRGAPLQWPGTLTAYGFLISARKR